MSGNQPQSLREARSSNAFKTLYRLYYTPSKVFTLKPMSWRHYHIPRPLLHRLFPLLYPSPSNTPSASLSILCRILGGPVPQRNSNSFRRGLSPHGRSQHPPIHTPIINRRQTPPPTQI
ncbi:hypothetical protein BDR07DRAFT_1034179 [Suillus spraguei]|nr:hypothetical protein BDR07DRAFT_1034179 [Suillus spraguei]